jgi:hypothetical protein
MSACRHDPRAGEVVYPKPGRLLTQQTLTLGALEARQR